MTVPWSLQVSGTREMKIVWIKPSKSYTKVCQCQNLELCYQNMFGFINKRKPGLIKIELESLDAKVNALEVSSCLKNYNALGNKVFVRSFQSYEQCVMTNNLTTILGIVDTNDEYRITRSSKIVKKTKVQAKTGE